MDWRDRYAITMAPQFVNGKVIVGVSGGEFEVRGGVFAFDAQTGAPAWTFFSTPESLPSAPSWAGKSWNNGGAPVWTTPAVDPGLGLIYVTTGNAAPDLNGIHRAGDNLYAASIVALDINTGKPDGISRKCITTFGTTTALSRPFCFRSTAHLQSAIARRAERFTYWIGETASHYTQSRKHLSLPGRPGSMRRRLSPCPPCRR